MNPELLEIIKDACERWLAGRENPNRTWLEAQVELNDFRSRLFPSDLSALIADYERLKDENERLKQHVADVNHDFEAALKECNEQHG